MPTIPLFGSLLDARLVAAHMLFPGPEEENERAKSLRASIALYAGEMLSSVPGIIENLDAAVARDMVRMTTLSPAPQAFQESYTHRIELGCVSGSAIKLAIEQGDVGAFQSLEAVKEAISAKFGKGFSVAQFNKHWGSFRPAAHLWAAYLTLHDMAPNPSFPAKPEQLPTLIALGQIYLSRAAALKAEKGRAILDVDTAWTPPADYQLPELDFAIEPACNNS